MDDIERLFDKAVGEVERLLSTRTVVGEPISIQGHTLVPLISVGFGYGVGGGENADGKKGSGHGGGAGAGGGVKPVAVVVISSDGVRVEPLKSGMASALEQMAGGLTRALGDRDGTDRRDEEGAAPGGA